MTADTARLAALDRIDRQERNFKLAFILGAAVELAFLVIFFLLADLTNRSHVLLLVSAVAIYTIIVLGLFALGAVVRKGTLMVLQGLETLQQAGR